MGSVVVARANCGLGFFFCQAEDGIRYRVRSRGLGDVYKRQVWVLSDTDPLHIQWVSRNFPWALNVNRVLTSYEHGKLKSDPGVFEAIVPVSYTHLTLPTNYSV